MSTQLNVKQKILDELSNMRGGIGTAPDIAVACGIGYNEVTPLISELLTDGKIELQSERTKVECRIYKVVTGESRMDSQQSLFA